MTFEILEAHQGSQLCIKRTMHKTSLPEVTMNSIGSYMKGDYALRNRLYHKTCEHFLMEVLASAALSMHEFARALERHMLIAEHIVFAAYDAMHGRDPAIAIGRRAPCQAQDELLKAMKYLDNHHRYATCISAGA
jgi:hypothetical protein